MKKKKNIKLILRTMALAIVMLFCASTMSGCLLLGLLGSPDEIDGGGLGEGDEYGSLEGLAGIKVCYKPDEYSEWDNLDELNKGDDGSLTAFQKMAENILDNLFYTYFMPTFDSSKSSIQIENSYNLWYGQPQKGINGRDIKGLIDYLNEDAAFKSAFNLGSYGLDKTQPALVTNVLAHFFERVRYETRVENITPQGGSSFTTVIEDKTKQWNWRMPTKYEELSSFFEFFYSLSTSPRYVLSIDGQYTEPYTLYVTNEYPLTSQKELYDYAMSVYYESIYGDFQSTFLNTYKIALTINIYEIVMGRTPTRFNISYSETAAPVANGATPERLAALQEEYKKFTGHVGLTNSERNTLASHILTEVIGSNATRAPNGVAARDVRYSTVVNALVEIASQQVYIGGSQGGDGNWSGDSDINDVYPAAMIMDYPATSFFLGLDDNNPFAAMPRAEYQSFVLMPDRADEIMAIWLAFQYDYLGTGVNNREPIPNAGLGINVTARYWNASTKKLNVLTNNYIRVPDGPYEPMGDNHLVMIDFVEDFGEVVKIPVFNNDIGLGCLATGGKPVPITGIRPGGLPIPKDFYTLHESSFGFGGIGALNPTQFPFSYLEILFDIEKDPNNPNQNCKFQVGITGYYQAG